MYKKFSLIYPTRNRPQFLQAALQFLEKQEYCNFEVIVCDNYTDASLSCHGICAANYKLNIKYVRPGSQLGMVENWNYALNYASGDYICYFTDKMFLLPGILADVNEIIQCHPVDVISWVDDKFYPAKYPDYFGAGLYKEELSGKDRDAIFEFYKPLDELRSKLEGRVPRHKQTASSYARGKICFGAYSSQLVRKITNNTHHLFYDISPDYTSMVLGLIHAETALEIKRPGIVHISTDLSNGGLGANDDAYCLAYLRELEGYPQFMEYMLVPGLYTSSHNVVIHDYLQMIKICGIGLQPNILNWLTWINQDLIQDTRNWSSSVIERQQKRLFENFVESNLNSGQLLCLSLRMTGHTLLMKLINKIKFFRKSIMFFRFQASRNLRFPTSSGFTKKENLLDLLN